MSDFDRQRKSSIVSLSEIVYQEMVVSWISLKKWAESQNISYKTAWQRFSSKEIPHPTRQKENHRIEVYLDHDSMAGNDNGKAAKLAKQERLLMILRTDKNLTLTQIINYVGVSVQEVYEWEKGSLASDGCLERMKELAVSDVVRMDTRVGKKSFRPTKQDLADREALMKTLSIQTPAQRVKTLKNMMKELDVSSIDFARLIVVTQSAVAKYLDEDQVISIPVEILKRIEQLQREIASGEVQSSPKMIFFGAMKTMLGEDLFCRGFTEPKDRRRNRLAKLLEETTSISYRTWYRHFPPYDRTFKVQYALARKAAEAAKKLGRIQF